MATIRKLSSGKWNVQVRLVGNKPLSRSFKSKSEANAWASQQEFCINQKHGEHQEYVPTWRDIGLLYCNQVLVGRPSKPFFEKRVEWIAKHKSMQKAFTSITLQDVNDYKQDRLSRVSPTTCRDELVTIKRVYRWADREARSQGLPSIENPCEYLTLPRARKPRDRVIEKEELELLISALTPEMALIVELAYETAMRRGEIINLRTKHLHLDQRLLSVVNGKEGNRSVPLSRRAVALLRKAAERCRNPNHLVFPVHPMSITQAVNRARKKVGLDDDVRFHQLRHTRISLVARKGFNNAQIMAVSGHKDIRSVQRYTHLNAADVVDLLD